MNWGHNANSFLLGFCIDFSFFPFLSQFCITYPYSTLMHVKLCGHATLASAHSLFMVNSNIIEFDTLSGILTAKTVPDVNPAYVSKIQNAISKALNGAPPIDIKRTTTADDLFVVLPSRKSVIEIGPLFDDILKCPGRGLIVSGVAPPDSKFDFISRFFCPKYGINEDPVCGSANCALAPYWTQMPKSVISLHMRYLSLSFPLNHSRKPMLLSLTLSY
ncbi:uncharacterized protein LOC111283279 isoform X2 [Durio zibethinus]|uniref:Uncharacterized protein LOC111283279 isoform X2 n=1 Tax=Durio zibethinus TaxID=66656 RepID=A0A6P5XGY5_DURZI|nr:uncharacterized protein LOC111283279 isoform X2 [Durio zibethinus]